ncbi:phosphonate ABC transporter ATP-binding protein [Paenibacillus xylaniclasticus]|uniref:phosphonate ABC transporter ATP-binding protein n=1 Tax=Paenibacillus xylaniclasticus TaxID=588083 RepID=UPI000FD8E58B|nr:MULTISPECIES: ATP-binding cassette domain-containing protein [Paenibacillus]GFN32333.1 phosphonates import ATP-binding protein PhnC [Paenibacillus curdlanolyticus]
MISVSHLTKQIPGGPKALDDISFEIESGEFIALKGASGSGKSMLLRCLAMRESWTKGTYHFDGKNITANPLSGRIKVRREAAYLEESPVLYKDKTALRNVIIGSVNQTPLWRRWTGMVRGDDYMGAMDTIENLGLLDKAHTKATHLSGGEKQRIAIARALVHGAKVILADEPVTGLDPHSADRVLSDLKRLCKEQGLVVIAALHGGDYAERFADRIFGLSGGKLLFDVKGRRLTEQERRQL